MSNAEQIAQLIDRLETIAERQAIVHKSNTKMHKALQEETKLIQKRIEELRK